jgi:methionyl aminopeptidase
VSIETQQELEGMKRAGRVVALTLAAMERNLRAGMTTCDLDEVARKVIEAHGARPTPKHEVGFPGVSCISINEEAVHGIPGARIIRADDVVKIDVTADLEGFVADAARTIVVEPKSEERMRLAWSAKSAFACGLAAAVIGKGTHDIGAAIERDVKRSGFAVIRPLCGHGVGRKMHEPPSVPNYWEPRMAHKLTPGLVITVEPIICGGRGKVYSAQDGWTVKTVDGSMAAHHEETIVVTRGRPMILTAA